MPHLINCPAIFKTQSNAVPIMRRTLHTSLENSVDLMEIYARNRELNSGKSLHAQQIISGLARRTHFAAKLVDFYGACGKITDARELFEKIPQTNLRRWIVLIGAYARYGFYREALAVFGEMQKEGLRPSEFIVPSVLKACGHLSDAGTGEKVHALILRYSLGSDAFVCSALIDMYAKSGQVVKGRRVFDRMAGRDLVALNAMVSGYVQCGLAEEALDLVKKCQDQGVKPNVFTWNTLIAGFSQRGDDGMVSELFNLMAINGVEPDVVSWTSVVSGLVQNFRNQAAFGMFRRMMAHGFHPASATISSLLPACASVANVRIGKEIHGFALVTGFEKDVYVRSALVDMYAKCGFIYEATALFCRMSERNSVTWNSMIFGFANNGYCREAIELFTEMQENDGGKIDHLTFTAAMTACSHAGMINLGQNLFHLMQEKYRIVPRLEHFACMVDLMGRAGKLAEAYDLIKDMPMEPDLFVWGALLGACRKHGNIDLAEVAAKHLSEQEPGSAGSNLLMSDIYANAGSWGNVARMKKMMKKMKLRKIQGCSWIETG